MRALIQRVSRAAVAMGDGPCAGQRREIGPGLLILLGVSKQALNTPLRQLIEMDLVRSVAPETDKRKRLLELTADGVSFEKALRREQVKLLQRVFAQAGEDAVNGWLAINHALGQSRQP